MRMKNRFLRMGKTLFGAMCLLSLTGLTYSCSDDYDLDETMPPHLGGSLYDELKARNFTTMVNLIDDLGYKEVLSTTGSKTIFAADDEAYKAFFAKSGWIGTDGNPVRDYSNLTTSQKKLLLNGCMLNSSYVLEMLSNTEGGGKNLCLRQTCSASILDSVRMWKWDELPVSKNIPGVDAEGNPTGDWRFWDKYATAERGHMYMVMDKTAPMMTHFLEGQMNEKNIKHRDIAFVVGDKNGWAEGADGGENRSYIYDSRVMEQDVVCLNGYIHVMDKAVVIPDNMAEVLRVNGTPEKMAQDPQTSTHYFSLLMERFSAPYYDYDLTDQYRKLKDIGNDSVYQKRYIADRSQSGKVTQSPDKKDLGANASLTYDPGWNQYAISSSVTKENDMAAIFVPNDASFEEYFLRGGGRGLMERYGVVENTKENLDVNISQIPLDIVQPLLNNLMKDSFNETVPSKYMTIMNDAQDQMFDLNNPEYASEEKFKERIKKVMLANNGVLYVMDRLITPADYAAVIGPALYSENTNIVKAVVRADDNYIEGDSYANAPLKKYYSTYLKAMQSNFSFFVPTDEGLGFYGLVDPMSIASDNPLRYRYWRMEYQNKAGAKLPIRAQAYLYNMETGQSESDLVPVVGGVNGNKHESTNSLNQGSGLVVKTLLIDMIDQHILVHEDGQANELNTDKKFFTARSGAPIIMVDNQSANGNMGMKVDGGFQYQLNAVEGSANKHHCTVNEVHDMTQKTNGYGNGMTYFLDRPMQATTRSVYNVLYKTDEFSEFFELCNTSFPEEMLKLLGLNMVQRFEANGEPSYQYVVDEVSGDTIDSTFVYDKLSNEDWKAEQNKYRVFMDTDGFIPAEKEKLVRFFNNYRYTVYVPTNAAVRDAIENKGLPTYETIEAFIESKKTPSPEGEGYVMAKEDQQTAIAMITMLVNFVKYHFQDQSFYVDNVTASGSYQTSCIDNKENVYIELGVNQTNGKITVEGAGNSAPVNVVAPYNLLARDANFDIVPKNGATSIKNSSYIVLHQVDNVLNFAPLSGGRYDAEWATPNKAKSFIQRYRLRK